MLPEIIHTTRFSVGKKVQRVDIQLGLVRLHVRKAAAIGQVSLVTSGLLGKEKATYYIFKLKRN